MEIVKATIKDIEEIARLRVDCLEMILDKMSERERLMVASQTRDLAARMIPENKFVAMLCKVDGKIASCAFMIINERPASPHFVTGITGTIVNVMTYPEYRRRGYAAMVINAIIDEAQKMGASMVELSATEEGQKLYKTIGFEYPKYKLMRIYF